MKYEKTRTGKLDKVKTLITQRAERVCSDVIDEVTHDSGHKIVFEKNVKLQFRSHHVHFRNDLFDAVVFNVIFPARKFLMGNNSINRIRENFKMSIGNYKFEITLWTEANNIKVNVYVHTNQSA